MKRLLALLPILSFCLTAAASPSPVKDDPPHVAWGDQGNGTFINPILNIDYSDPDAIRVGDTYYMVASDFHFTGMQILSSKDLVNWSYITQVYDRFDYPGWDDNRQYGQGSWAPAIRYHDGRFYIYFCTPVEGLFMTSAERPEGPWSKLLLVHEGAGWEDPCPFWDEDGQAYLGHSMVGAGPIIIHKMSPDGTRLLDDGVEVYRGPVAEGTKIHKWNGRYYFSIPEGGVGPGWQTILRSASIYGPFDRKVVLETGSTNINGPHQGSIVDTPDGEWYFLHFQKTDVIGRVVHLQPVFWKDGWPEMGVDIDRNGIGEPVLSWKMPSGGDGRHLPATSDDFSSSELGVQWQFNHNPVPEAWSLTRKKGFLVMDALEAPSFKMARNTLTQKLVGYQGTVFVTLDLSGMEDGQRVGLACMGSSNHLLGIRQDGKQRYLYLESSEEELLAVPCKDKTVRLGFSYDSSTGDFQFLYAAGSSAPQKVGEPVRNGFGFWKGVRPAIFNYNTLGRHGSIAVDSFNVAL